MELNPDEVSEIVYKSMDEIESSLQLVPHKFTAWFLIAFPQLKQWMKQHNFAHAPV
jgi:isopentenyl-diphosphate delta-isomerase